ncbi:MAG: hypothetical protein QM523_08505 [Candidatus Pacebacteria bacterium]|nr:hypothetical protein [Candidatus Paceibacterota bacterium]
MNSVDVDSIEKRVASIIADGGGVIVGRTRLQKIAYLLTVVGFEDDLQYGYKYYGPYSEVVAAASSNNSLIREEITYTDWGSFYSIFSLAESSVVQNTDRSNFIIKLKDSNAVVLELMATAVYCAKEKYDNPWQAVMNLKPEKASKNMLSDAKRLYSEMLEFITPRPLPKITE